MDPFFLSKNEKAIESSYLILLSTKAADKKKAVPEKSRPLLTYEKHLRAI